MNILIVGAAGYIGTKLTQKCLNYGYKVIAVDNLLFNQGHLVANIFQHKNCTFYKLDIEEIDNDIISKCDIIYPLAALVGMPICKNNIEECYRVNTIALQKLILKTSHNQRIIFPNTNSGYGTTQNQLCTEETPLNSISDYGKSKELAEKFILEHRPKHSTIFRLATVYGPSIRPRIDLLVNYFVFNAIHLNKLSIYEGNFNRNFVHIDDVVDAFFELLYNGFTFGQVYNLGCDEDNMNKDTLIKLICSYLPNTKIMQLSQKDPDKRNYLVSSNKLSKYFKAKRRLSTELYDLINFFKLIPNDENILKYMKNY